jgi:hypothetical protein
MRKSGCSKASWRPAGEYAVNVLLRLGVRCHRSSIQGDAATECQSRVSSNGRVRLNR